MNQIKKLIDKISLMEGRQSREVVLPLNDARELRDEILKILLDKQNSNSSESVEVVMQGSKW